MINFEERTKAETSLRRAKNFIKVIESLSALNPNPNFFKWLLPNIQIPIDNQP